MIATPAAALPYAFATAHGVVVIDRQPDHAQVAVRAGARASALAEARRALGIPLRARQVDAATFARLLSARYEGGQADAAAAVLDLAPDADVSRLLETLPRSEELLEAGDDAPLIRFINALFTQALRAGASDIHVEPFAARSVVRLRIDGALSDLFEPPRALHAAIVSRLKVMAQLDIAEKRLPQDGRIALKLAGRPIDVRVSTIPTGHGERVVLRLFDQQSGPLDLAQLGMDTSTLAGIDALIRAPHGILLATGPTGSGKTTTLYAALARLDAQAQNIMTVEDPIEYALEGVSQSQINSRIDMSFARALRAILRQDPDVVMIGEIRDAETAQIAVQASLTGHLVLATLHTNDAPSAVTRLVDMGIEPFLLASSLLGVCAQRLVRKLCIHCRAAETAVGRPDEFRPQGCERCHHTGYRGRTGIYELMRVDDTLRRLIHDRAPEHTLREQAHATGLRPLREDAERWIAQGVTAREEVLRVARE